MSHTSDMTSTCVAGIREQKSQEKGEKYATQLHKQAI